ncbi:transposase [Chakrabartyella piscis]|uniref:transposase n=1 Tax=Chakrabartyella piscis TaxID=2918914 RepID=UPI0029587483|nr:transposase [Chakrabartyella piscis]
MDLPKRKQNRLANYDYSQNGAYFITICTKDKQNILWNETHVVGASSARQKYTLSDCGRIVDTAIMGIDKIYTTITIDKYVIMPNHIHMILVIENDGRALHAPTISHAVQQMKGIVTKQIGHTIWQKSFHDHIIRGEKEYLKILEYMETNPLKWELDCYYIKEI